MNIISHVTEMIEKATPSAYVALSVIGVLAVLVLIGALKGFTRGVTRQTVRLITVGISAVGAYLATTLLTGAVIGYFDGKTVEQIVVDLGFAEQIASLGDGVSAIIYGLSVETVQYILALPLAVVLAPILFLLLFVILSAIMLIVHAVISGALGFSKSKNNVVTRLCGMAMGAVQGVFVTAIVLLPVMSILGVCTQTVGAIDNSEKTVMVSDGNMEAPETPSELEGTVAELYDEYLSDVAESPVLKFLDAVGGKLINKKLATVKIGGESRDMRVLLPTLFGMASDVSKLTDLDFENLSAEDKVTIEALVEKIGNEKFTALVISDVFRSVATAIDSKALEIDSVPEEFQPVVLSAVTVFKGTTPDNVKTDLGTLCDVFFIVADSGLLSESEIDTTSLIEVLLIPGDGEEKGLLVEIIDVLSNSRFDGVTLDVIKTLSTAIKLPDDGSVGSVFVNSLLNSISETQQLSKIRDDLFVVQDLVVLAKPTGLLSGDVKFEKLLEPDISGNSILYQMLSRLDGTSFEKPIVNVVKTLTSKNEETNKYEILASLPEPIPTIAGPLLDVLSATDDIIEVRDDITLMEDVVELLKENELIGENIELDYMTLMFERKEKDDGTLDDTVLVKIIGVFDNTRYEQALTSSIKNAANEAIDLEKLDATMKVVVESMLTLLNKATDLDSIKNDLNAISDMMTILEEDGVMKDGEADIFALVTKKSSTDENGETVSHTTVDKILNIFDDGSHLEDFVVDVVQGLAAASNNNQIDFGELQEPTLSFVTSAMTVFETTEDVNTLRADMTTISNILDILDKNGYISDNPDNPITVDVIELFTNNAKESENTVIDLILKEFDDNPGEHLNPVLLSLVQSFSGDIRKISVAEPFDMLVASVADVFTNSTDETVINDVNTISDVFVVLADAGVFEPGKDAAELLTKKTDMTKVDENGDEIFDENGEPVKMTVVDNVVYVLNSNTSTQPIVTDFTKLSLSLIMKNNVTGALGDGKGENSETDIDKTYEDVKTGIDEVINVGLANQDKTTEEQKAAVSDKLTEILNSNLGSSDGSGGEDGDGVIPPATDVVDKEVVDAMAGYIVDEYLTSGEDGESVKIEDLVGTLYEEVQVEVPVTDEDGNPVLDENGSEVTETVTQTQISDAGLNDVILNYYDAYLQYLESQKSTDGN